MEVAAARAKSSRMVHDASPDISLRACALALLSFLTMSGGGFVNCGGIITSVFVLSCRNLRTVFVSEFSGHLNSVGCGSVLEISLSLDLTPAALSSQKFKRIEF